MLIKVSGVWIPNKGAELMAWTAVSELRRRLPQARFCSTAQGPAEVRRAIGMPQLPDAGSGPGTRLWRDLVEYGPWPGLGGDRHPGVTHVVDISGFAYGDFWGTRKARNSAGLFVRRNTPIYLMPQAFGPFTSRGLRAEMRRIVTGARRVLARDRISERHLTGLGTTARIGRAPDITFGLDVARRPVARPARPYAALVVNRKLIDAGAMDEAMLLHLFGQAAERFQAKGWQVDVVLHEPRADRDLGRKLCAMRGLDLVELQDARDIKAYLGGAECLLTARFHGLVNGLAAGVPCFAVGWSHKYAELLGDFDCGEMILAGDVPRFLAAIDAFLADDAARLARRAAIRGIAAGNRAALAEVWDDVAEDILRTERA